MWKIISAWNQKAEKSYLTNGLNVGHPYKTNFSPHRKNGGIADVERGMYLLHKDKFQVLR